MSDITQAIAFLESLNLAHGDLRRENIVLDCNRVKVTDFGNTAPFGTPFHTCLEPWEKELRMDESGYDSRILAGLLGPRTEQFALGPIYYYVNYGVAIYEDKTLTEVPRDRGVVLKN